MKNVSRMLMVVIVLSLVLVTVAVAGPEMKISEDSWISLSFLGQAHYSLNKDVVDDEDFYLRRGRIIVQGQMMDGVKFFVETDNDNAGKNGVASASMDIQDAFMDVRLMKNDNMDMWLQGGLILLPLSLENCASAASLLGIDYNAEAVKFVNSFVWRDYGAELHGQVAKKVAYRIGAFDGYDSPAGNKNDEAPLRYTGRVDVNLIGEIANGGWFYSQNQRGKKGNYLIVGAGFDQQDEATMVDIISVSMTNSVAVDSDAWVVDFQSSFAINDKASVLVNAGYYEWDNSAFDGKTQFVESGVLVGDAMVTGKLSLTDPDIGENTEDYTAGLHYFIKGQNARIGVEHRWGDSSDWTLVGLQFLL